MNNVAELLRLIENLLRFGVIAEVDHGELDKRLPAVRVRSGQLLTGWLPWANGRAGTTRDWNPPTVGEQVMILSPGGDLANGVAMPSLFQLSAQPPSNEPGKNSREYPDGALIEYDHARSVLRINLPGSIEIHAPGGTQWMGSIAHQGDMQREGSYQQNGGELSHNGKNVGSDHTHGGVQSGGSNTGEPT
ncbi:phage baseplate assembly protein V [Vreelandella nanhaiensis]|uniref:Phage baseplate assembly protein V n=1 Tax=Vreelandella nanhaiensis TaxID=1258546 RepID=A0A433KG84_9GAMM|nr:phage baseplate assembly protein V [Halomonas nanhaiensis]RUR27698.1 phage baseplate assembly protein V [Halomonas nanhaiensis]